MKRFAILILSLLIMAATNSNAQGKYADVNGIKMYYEIHGSGKPLVLLHGGGSTIKTTFGTILPGLAKTHEVIAIELQAHGHTGDRDAPETFDQDAADVAELLKQLNIQKADIFGFSNGGQTAMVMGIKYPGRVNKLIIASAFYSRDAVPPGFWDGFKDPKFSDMPQIYKDEYLKIKDQAGLMNMFRKDSQRMGNFKGWTDEEVNSIKAPSLIVIGDRDLPTPEHVAKMHRLIQNSRLAILPGTHGSYMGEAMSWGSQSKMPALFVAMVNEFLTDK
jgi:pimeloyl-ACP methyl ester carboxylesterase